MAGALDGIRVLEMANVISGPFTGMLLADLGAEVIKVEAPGSGDPFRAWAGDDSAITASFAAYNRGKKSVTINIQSESGQAVYRRLASSVDVVLENFRPGTLDRYGIGYDDLKNDNPRLVYCSITGMGSVGPYKSRPTYDAIAQGMSGLWSQLTDMADPEPVGPPISDQLTGLYGVYGILGALVSRSLTGQGQRLELSMLGASIGFQPLVMADHLMDGLIATKSSRPHNSQSYAFVGSDGLPFAIHLSSPQKFWEGLAQAVGRPELVTDPRFEKKAGRVEHYDMLRGELMKAFSTKPRDEWLGILAEHDVPAGPVYTIEETVQDPQVQAIKMVRTFGEGKRALELLGFPVNYHGTPLKEGLPPPQLGEHTAEVLAGLGLSQDEIANMSKDGAI